MHVGHLLQLDCYLLTTSGRTAARTPSTPALPANRAALSVRGAAGTTLRIQAESGTYDAWHLHLPAGAEVRRACSTR